MSGIGEKTTLVALQGMRDATRDIAKASERLVTGKRINQASDDPAGFAQAVRLQAEIGSYAQVRKSVTEASAKAAQAGSSLTSIADFLVEMRSIALLASSETDGDKLATYQETFAGLRSAIADIVSLDPMLGSTATTLDVQIDEDGATKSYSFAAIDSTALGINASDLTATAGASAALTAVDTALETVLAEVGTIGGYQNSLQFTTDFIDNTILNKTTQYRDLTDADMALEATNLAAAKIRQDASTAVMAQANSMNRAVADYLLNGALG